MRKIIFLSDFFIDEVYGGAELCDDVMITELEKKDFNVKRCKTSELIAEDIRRNRESFFIVSNFIALSEEVKEEIKKCDYVIMEHDHKYLRTRDPSYFKDYDAPVEFLINTDFYRKAQAVLCQSRIHATVVRDNLILDNVVNLGCSLWSDEHIDILRSNCNNDKDKEAFVLDSSNPIKGTNLAAQYCMEKNIEFDCVGNLPYEDLVKQLSTYRSLVFFPKTLESFCRFLLEAKMLNCKIITNARNGCTSEPWFPSLRGEELIDFVQDMKERTISELIKVINGKETSLKIKPKEFPKVSLVTSMFKGDKYIEKFLNNITSQTVFDKCELIIIDANSPDNEYSVIEKYMKKHDNIRYEKLDYDPGIYGCWNIGIKKAKGKYVSNANLDDIRSKDQVEMLTIALEKNPEVDLAYSEAYVTKVPNETYESNSSKGQTYPITDFSKPAMVKCLPGCMPIWKKAMHDKAGLFDKEYRYAGDWEMWLRAVRNGSVFKRIQGVHGLYYMNPDGLSTSQANEKIRFSEEKKVFWEYVDVYGYDVVERFSAYFSREV